MEGTFLINGKEVKLSFNGYHTLLRVLRDNGFVEVKEGCARGECGACTVMVDGKLNASCQILAASVIGKKILTVKGVGDIFKPHIIQTSLVETTGVQCGFCIPGKVMAAQYLLARNSDPTDDDIKHALDGNLCRCTGYVKIVEGIKLAAKRMREDAK